MPLNKRIGARLRAARFARGLSPEELADLTLGALHKSRIHNYEHGLCRLSVEDAEVLANTLGNVTAAHLLCLDSADTGLSDEETRLLQAYRRSDQRSRETITAVGHLLSLNDAGGTLAHGRVH
ncbi:helix-turn-helix transcriptional regulator [Thiohalocapsa marina]|uniref:Helix-turn-helix transcriptional regulator n=1 Tax=Thiohalocapsa marina TaxID=424902 RepID=A0A5M8FRV1_9GAMM|nr:helix-turn-helix transcriptional regulator [Thiohalocapsa marina]KAA6184212.1 helix-turn-helix transcriptional regulator [Thiohalocapsa marina]